MVGKSETKTENKKKYCCTLDPFDCGANEKKIARASAAALRRSEAKQTRPESKTAPTGDNEWGEHREREKSVSSSTGDITTSPPSSPMPIKHSAERTTKGGDAMQNNKLASERAKEGKKTRKVE